MSSPMFCIIEQSMKLRVASQELTKPVLTTKPRLTATCMEARPVLTAMGTSILCTAGRDGICQEVASSVTKGCVTPIDRHRFASTPWSPRLCFGIRTRDTNLRCVREVLLHSGW
mmetsp:Transcript_91187/g.157761  ORF Transcript_91187/g.157761 Transcript_91187/m.157761 type:complete len:114 (-) Transcript_91187:178-519(-)